MKKLTALFGAGALAVAIAAHGVQAEEHHVKAELVPVGGSGVSGFVQLVQMPDGGTRIQVMARGLSSSETYVSLYYDNHVCALEPYSEEDVIGTYSGNAAGNGRANGEADDDLDEINSVSVRRASDFSLLACADVHP